MGVRLAWLVAVLAAIAVVAVVGCTSERNGDPAARPTTGSSETSQSDGAPRVDEPLDATGFMAQPCAVLSQQQLAEFSVTRPGLPTTTGAVAENVGPFCTWHDDPDLGSTIGVGLLPGNKHGLADTYRGRAQFEHFEPTTVDGYPAVYANSPDLRSEGSCGITVGISDTLAFNASEQGQLDAEGACEKAKQVASAALATLKGGG